MTWTRIGGWTGIAASLVVSIALAAGAEETSSPEHSKKQGTLGSRVVGVSCVCYPDGRSIAEMEKLIDTAALDKPDLILLTEGCMQNSPRAASRQE